MSHNCSRLWLLSSFFAVNDLPTSKVAFKQPWGMGRQQEALSSMVPHGRRHRRRSCQQAATKLISLCVLHTWQSSVAYLATSYLANICCILGNIHHTWQTSVAYLATSYLANSCGAEAAVMSVLGGLSCRCWVSYRLCAAGMAHNRILCRNINSAKAEAPCTPPLNTAV